MLSRCVKSIESSKRFADSDTFKKAKDKEIDWLTKYLKSLRPQPNTVSVENATKFGNPEYERGIKDGIQHTKNHQWKPSEEQMNALNFAITHFVHYTNYKNLTELRELYDDLLKLL